MTDHFPQGKTRFCSNDFNWRLIYVFFTIEMLFDCSGRNHHSRINKLEILKQGHYTHSPATLLGTAVHLHVQAISSNMNKIMQLRASIHLHIKHQHEVKMRQTVTAVAAKQAGLIISDSADLLGF